MESHIGVGAGTPVLQAEPMLDGLLGVDEVLPCLEPCSRLDEMTDDPVSDRDLITIPRCQFDFLDTDESTSQTRAVDDLVGDTGATVWLRAIRPSQSARSRAQTAETVLPRRGVDLAGAATSYLRSRADGQLASPSAQTATNEQWVGADVFQKLHEAAPETAANLARGLVGMPGPGDEFLGFRIVEELGRGTFGRVFLAKQGDLADRLVALKVTAELPGESQTLAQLQHTNIVPIFSAHHAAPLHAVCMPYFGRATLADLLDDVNQQGSLPDSGKALVQTVESRRSVMTLSRPLSNNRLDSAADSDSLVEAAPSMLAFPSRDRIPSAGAPSSRCSETLHQFDGLSYVDTILWMLSRIANGLAHAHERGIMHRDLKPANVLMTDDGQPMILDFNLSENLANEAGASTASAGGTLRYMSPEHIERFLGKDVLVDTRSDLYALGVIFHELLTGQVPFATFPSCSIATLHAMIAERRRGVPSCRDLNPAITPAVDSMIRHCLEPDPARRYQTALQLHEDLERHLANLPLKYAPEPSIRERTRKWSKRHPRLGSTTTFVLVASLCVVCLAAALWGRNQRLFQLEAAEKFAHLHQDVSSIRFLLSHRTADQSKRQEGQKLAQAALRRYDVLDDPKWTSRPLVASLAPAAATQLRFDVAEILLMLTQVTVMDAAGRDNQAEKDQLARSAQRFNQAALAVLPAGQEPQAFRVQHAALVRLLGQEDEGARLQQEADKIPLKTARDHYLVAAAKAVRGEYRQALPLAEEAVRLDPQHFWSYFILGVCHDHLEHHAEAMACFTACTALRPDYAETWLYRGLAYLKRNDPERAQIDFDRAHRLRPDWYEPLLERGMASSKLGDHVKAENDLTQALELGAPETRIHFLRAAERRASGDRRGAELDQAEGLKREPTDAQSWISRGIARLETNPDVALTDFQAALKIEPNLLEAMHYCSYVLCGLPGRDAAAIQMLDRIITVYPSFAMAWSGRGVQHAVMGKRDEALRDAREAVWRDTSPAILYQVAGIYATTSKTHPEDRIEAYRYLSAALRAGFGFELLDIDHELDAIRGQPEFRELVDAARIQAKERLRHPVGR